MNIKSPFQNGINSIFRVEWNLELETPLVVRNGRKFSWDNSDNSKDRNNIIKVDWSNPKTYPHEVMDLHAEVVIKNKKAMTKYTIPANSIRGVLRDWTIKHLITERQKWRWTLFETLEGDLLEQAVAELQKHMNGFSLLCDLFGMILGSQESTDSLAQCGRLQISCEKFENESNPGMITIGKLNNNSNLGPNNVSRQINQRGPVDRITHGAVSGGLHTFLEFSKGQNFTVNLSIVNPTTLDIELVTLWQREINTSMIRFGAITSIGRGKVKIGNNPKFYIHALKSSEIVKELSTKNIKPQIGPQTEADILDELWDRYEFDEKTFTGNLQKWLKKEEEQ